MTVLLRKEIRSLFPAWVLTMAAAAVPGFVRPDRASVWLFFVAIGALLLGITSFGSEFSQGTFPLLLAQPIPRRKIWRIKTITLGVALMTIAIMVWVAVVCGIFHSGGWVVDVRAIRSAAWTMPLVFTVLILGAAFAGGLLSTLATRQMATAFWTALLFPVAVCGVALIFTIGRSDKTVMNSIAVALAVYDVCAFLVARYQFLRAQDLPGASGTVVSLPVWLRLGAKVPSATTTALHRPVRALIVKECQLHQVSLGFAAALLVLHIVVLCIRRAIFVPTGQQKELYDILGTWWLLWFVLPVVIAGSAIAEERRQGTLEGSLCLPARKSTQWFVKCVVCFFLAIFFGAVTPWFLETAAQWTGAPSPVFQGPSLIENHNFLVWVVSVAAFLTLIAFYASSLSRSLLQSVGVAILSASVASVLGAQVISQTSHYLLPVWLPAFSILLLWLSYINFKQITVGRRLWLRNVLVLLFVMALLLGSIAYLWQFTQYL